MNAKIITVGDSIFLGTINCDGGVVTLSKAQPVQGPDVTVADLANYLKNENAGTLEKDIVIRGNNVTFSERELSDDLQDEATILEARFAKAKKTAMPSLINAAFDAIR